MSIDECRIKEFFLFYLLKRAKRSLRLVAVVAPTPRRATSTIRSAEGGSIIIRHSMRFLPISYDELKLPFSTAHASIFSGVLIICTAIRETRLIIAPLIKGMR